MSLTKLLPVILLMMATGVQASTRDEIERLWNPQGMAVPPAQPAADTSARTEKPAPRWFRLSNGRQVNLADWKVVLFMQGRCPYCHQFDPVLKQLAQQYGFSVFPYTLDGQGDTAFPEALPVPPDVMQTFFPNIPVAVFVLISLLVNVRTSVQIIDNSDLVKVHRVDNVPVGLAMPLSLTTRIRMFSQIANIMLYCLFIFFWILVGLVLWVKISWQTFVNGCIYWWCTTLEGMRDLIKSQPVYEIQYYGKTFRMNAAQVLHDKYMIWCGEQLWSAFVLASVVALVICLITFFVVSWILGRQGKQQSENEVTGGRQLTDNPKDVARMLKKDGKDSDIRIGDLPIIRDSEIQNFCLHGTVSTGKSEVIRRLANYARKRGDMVVIYDRSCEFVKSYYDPSIDKILNPLDARCAAWDLWKECLTQPDFDNVANTLIPMGTKEDPFWQGSGRTIFAEAAYLMRNDPNRSYSKLVDTLLSIKIEKLRTFLRNSPAANLVEEKIEKTAISIRAVLTNYVKAIRYLQGIEHNGEPFTIRDWMRGVREDQKNGWLFISSNADTHASLKPVVSMWLSIAIRGLLAMGENRNRRVWFFCDELSP